MSFQWDGKKKKKSKRSIVENVHRHVMLIKYAENASWTDQRDPAIGVLHLYNEYDSTTRRQHKSSHKCLAQSTLLTNV